MKIGALTILAVAELVAEGKDVPDRQLSPVTVYVQYSVAEIGQLSAAYCAEALASEMFTQAGVQIQWRLGQPKGSQGEQPIIMEITSDTPEAFYPRALAYSREFEGIHIRIFWDRVLGAGPGGVTRPLLAHVMVHEITPYPGRH